MKFKSTDLSPRPRTSIGATCCLATLGHPTASPAVYWNRVNRASPCDCHNGSPRITHQGRDRFANANHLYPQRVNAPEQLRREPLTVRATDGLQQPVRSARFVASPSTQDADTPATEMLPHIVFRGIGILTRRGERTPSCISPGEPDPRNVFLESLRHYPSHGAADRQPCGSMGRNCDHNPDVPPCVGLFPGLFQHRTADGGAEPAKCHLTIAFRSMITLCLF